MASGPCRIYYAKECPLKDECSANSWKKARCWSKNPNTVMTMVIDHLVSSGNHPDVSTREEAARLTEGIELGHYDEVDKPKKRKADQADDDSGPAQSRQPKTPPDALIPVNPRPKVHAASSSHRDAASGSSVLTLSTTPTVRVIPNMNHALDAMHRAVATARHAEQLCDRASQQFRQGCGVARGLPRNRVDRRHEQLDISMSRASHEFREAWWHQQKDHAAIRSPSQRSPPLDTEHRASGPHRLTI